MAGNTTDIHFSSEGHLCSLKGAEWGKEERHSNPFAPGQEFDLRVRAHEDKFEITANQKEIAEFKHRVPLQNIDHFQVGNAQWDGN